jgi:hypothetical protein
VRAVCRRRFAPIGGKIGENPEPPHRNGKSCYAACRFPFITKGARTTDNLFHEVKERLNLIDTAKYYGIQPNRSGFVNCLFHKEKTPSLKLYPAHFHCYGCGKHGDIITLTTQLFTLPPYHAAQKLAQDFNIIRGNSFQNMKPRISEQLQYYQQEQKTFRLLNDYCLFLEKWREDYRPATPDEDFHPLFVESLTKYEQYNYYRDIFITGTEDERRDFMKICAKEIAALDERFTQPIKTKRSVSHER